MALQTFSHPLFGRNSNDGITIQDAIMHTGQIWYVDSVNGTDAAHYGTRPESRALASLAYLTTNAATLGLAAGDEVIFAPNHDEDIANAQIVTATAGVWYHANPNAVGDAAPVFSYDHANASIQVTANDCLFEGLRFRPSVTGVLIGVYVDTDVTGTKFKNCEWMLGEDGAGTDEFAEALHLESGNHDTVVDGCRMLTHSAAAGSTHGIYVDAASNRLTIKNNIIKGPWATAAILEDAAGIEHTFLDNYINVTGLTAGFHANSTFASGRLVDGFASELGCETIRTTGAIPQTTQTSLFTITGSVMITAVVGTVTTNIGAVANASYLDYNPTAGVDSPLCATLDINGDVAGTTYGVIGDPTVAMVRMGAKLASPLILGPGVIEMDCAGNDGGGGRVQWTVYWKPITSAGGVAAA